MKVTFRTRKWQKVCSKEREARRELGDQSATKLMVRMAELCAADVLSDISHLPPARLHEHGGRGNGIFSVDLKHPYRLFFIPADDPVPRKDDGGIDLDEVRAIEVIDISDPHRR
jgi:plasmid maintenance system killer protein